MAGSPLARASWLARGWDLLAIGAARPPAPAWLLSRWEHLTPPSARLHVVLIGDGLDPVALAPFFVQTGARSPRPAAARSGSLARPRPAVRNATSGDREFAGSLGDQVVKVFDLAIADRLREPPGPRGGLQPTHPRNDGPNPQALLPRRPRADDPRHRRPPHRPTPRRADPTPSSSASTTPALPDEPSAIRARRARTSHRGIRWNDAG